MPSNHPSSIGRTTAPTTSSLDVAAESSDGRASIIETPTNNIVNILRKLKMIKMPRVTVKLRKNDTIPQMYMKAGIASYKKGKITTSVLAQSLSLEGLIFKTPEGTIKPWRDTWPFGGNADILRRKVSTRGCWLSLYVRNRSENCPRIETLLGVRESQISRPRTLFFNRKLPETHRFRPKLRYIRVF